MAEEDQVEAAIAAYGCAIGQNPDFAAAYAGRAQLYLDLGQVFLAREDYQRVIDLSPDDASAYLNLGWALYLTGEHGAAVVQYDRAIALRPAYARAYNNRGLAHLRLGDRPQALSDFQKAAELGHDPVEWPYRNLVDTFVQMRDYAQAARAAEALIAAAPDHPEGYRLLGEMRDQLGELEAAEAAYRLYLEKAGESASAGVIARIQGLTLRRWLIQWGALILAALFIAVGGVYLRRRRR